MTGPYKTKAEKVRAATSVFDFRTAGADSGASSHRWWIDPAAAHAAISTQEIPGTVLLRLRTGAGFSAEEISGVLGVSLRTIGRREHSLDALSTSEADRAFRLARVTHAAADAIGQLDKAVRWLRKPNAALGGAIPLKLIETEPGTELVLGALDRIAYGGVV
jgi:putative toxin-antitoxin system antitoxin component (TIGR02293 family)